MPRYRKKPVEIEAVHLTADRGALVIEIPTLEGVMRAGCGDWIIKGVQNEFYPCKDAIFRETYEPVESTVTWQEFG
jgi:hypothetical protein